jgi:hypothetical protein
MTSRIFEISSRLMSGNGYDRDMEARQEIYPMNGTLSKIAFREGKATPSLTKIVI